MKKLLNNKKGFTLVELIVVIVILGILAAILAPSLLKWIDKSRQTQSQSNAYTIYTTVQEMVATEYAKADTDWATFEDNFADDLTNETGFDLNGTNGDNSGAYVECTVARTNGTNTAGDSTGVNVSLTLFHYLDKGTQTLLVYDFANNAWQSLIDGDSSLTVTEDDGDGTLAETDIAFSDAPSETSINLIGLGTN